MNPQRDIVVSFQEDDSSFGEKLAAHLKVKGWSVWCLEGGAHLKEEMQLRDEAVLKCKMFLIILSSSSMQDQQCLNNLALAYISNSLIIPVARAKKYQDLSPHLDSRMKLILSKLNWCFFEKDCNFLAVFECLAKSITQGMKKLSAKVKKATEKQSFMFDGINMSIQFNSLNLSTVEEQHVHVTAAPSLLCYDFWDRHFLGQTAVNWQSFIKHFLMEYKEKLKEQYSINGPKLFVKLLFRDIFYHKKTVQKVAYDVFCGENLNVDQHCFFNRLLQYAVGYYTMREVFSMDSRHRLIAILNLGSFSSPAVISALDGMLKDADANIRAVAVIALAKSGKTRKRTVDKIFPLVEDEDRLVRESAVLSLGYLRDQRAVSVLMDQWRNDPVSSVQDAALLSLRRIGGEKANRCIQVTDMLMKEIAALKKQLLAMT